MAMTTVNAVYLGSAQCAPASSTQVFDWSDMRGTQAERFVGYATITGDSSTTTCTVNYIDGTNALPFTPAMILACRVGGSEATGTVNVVSMVDAANSAKTATVKFSTTFSGTIIVGFKIYQA